MLSAVLQLPIGFLIALSGALVPGPLLTYIVAKAPRAGKHVGFYATLGHAVVEFLILALVLAGLGVVLQHHFSQAVVGSTGGALLLGISLLSVRKLNQRRVERQTFIKYSSFVGGVVYSSVMNPTVPLWWATIGLAMLMDAYVVGSLLGVFFWLVGHYLADFGWFGLVSISAAKGGRLMSPRSYRRFLGGCAVFLGALGVYLIFKYSSLFLE